MNFFFYHKDLGNHLLQLRPKVVKHPVYATTAFSDQRSAKHRQGFREKSLKIREHFEMPHKNSKYPSKHRANFVVFWSVLYTKLYLIVLLHCSVTV